MGLIGNIIKKEIEQGSSEHNKDNDNKELDKNIGSNTILGDNGSSIIEKIHNKIDSAKLDSDNQMTYLKKALKETRDENFDKTTPITKLPVMIASYMDENDKKSKIFRKYNGNVNMYDIYNTIPSFVHFPYYNSRLNYLKNDDPEYKTRHSYNGVKPFMDNLPEYYSSNLKSFFADIKNAVESRFIDNTSMNIAEIKSQAGSFNNIGDYKNFLETLADKKIKSHKTSYSISSMSSCVAESLQESPILFQMYNTSKYNSINCLKVNGLRLFDNKESFSFAAKYIIPTDLIFGKLKESIDADIKQEMEGSLKTFLIQTSPYPVYKFDLLTSRSFIRAKKYHTYKVSIPIFSVGGELKFSNPCDLYLNYELEVSAEEYKKEIVKRRLIDKTYFYARYTIRKESFYLSRSKKGSSFALLYSYSKPEEISENSCPVFNSQTFSSLHNKGNLSFSVVFRFAPHNPYQKYKALQAYAAYKLEVPNYNIKNSYDLTILSNYAHFSLIAEEKSLSIANKQEERQMLFYPWLSYTLLSGEESLTEKDIEFYKNIRISKLLFFKGVVDYANSFDLLDIDNLSNDEYISQDGVVDFSEIQEVINKIKGYEEELMEETIKSLKEYFGPDTNNDN